MTLLFAAALFATAQAQSSKDEARNVVLGQPKKTTSSQESRNVILGKNGQYGRTQPVYRTDRVYKTDRRKDYHYGKKNNPGKHLGWYKGVGNPHKYGMQPGRGKHPEHGKGHGHEDHDD